MINVRQTPKNHGLIGPNWMAEAGRDTTGLGGVFILMLLTSAVAGFLAIVRQYRTLLLLCVTVGSGVGLSLLLKHFFARPRPSIVPHLSHVYTSSFPSGHSMMSAVVYLTLAALLASTLEQRMLKIYVFVLAFAATFLVGLSRVYLGVHYPTDVLAGWTAGIVWSLLVWIIANRISGRRVSVEDHADSAP